MAVLAMGYSCSSCVRAPSVFPSNSRVTNSRPASSIILLKEPHILSKTARGSVTTVQKHHSESYLARQSPILQVQESTDLESALARLGESLKVQDLNAILRHFGMLNRGKDLSQIFDWMRQNGKIDVSSYSSYIKFMGRSLSSLKALEIYNSITDTSIKNNIFICNSVLSCMVRNGNFDSGIKLFNQMKADGLSPDVVTYSTLLAGCIKVKHRYSKALQLIHELQSNGMQMDDVIYGTLLAVCASHHKWQEAESYFKQMNDEGRSPNVFHYASLLNAYSVGGNYIKAEKLVQDMKSAGLVPNKVILTTLLKVYVKGGLFEKSRELLLELESLGYAKDEMPFCLLMDGLAKARRIEEAKAVFDEMKAKQVASDGYSYSIMISAFCRDGLLDEAKQLAKDFEAAYDRYDLVMLNTLLCAYCKSGEIDSVIQLLRRMDQLAISPDNSTFHILIKYFCKQKLHLLAYKTIMDMHSKGHQPEEELCSSLIYHLGKMRAYSEAFSVYKILRYSKRTMCKALHEKILHILIAGNLLKNAYVVVKDNAGLISSPSVKKFGANFMKSGDINLINDVMKAIHGTGNQIDQDLFQLAVRRYIEKPETKELFFQLMRWMPGQGYVLDSSTRNLILKNSHLFGRRYIAEILSEHHFLLKGYAYMTHVLNKVSNEKLLVVLEGVYNLRSISSSATAVIKVLLGEDPGCDDLINNSPSKAGRQAVLEVLKVEMNLWPKLETTFTELQSEWGMYACKSKPSEFAPDFTSYQQDLMLQEAILWDAAIMLSFSPRPLGQCSSNGGTHVLNKVSNGKLLVVLEGGYNLRSISSSATTVIKVLLGEDPGCDDLINNSPSKAGRQAVLEVLKVQMNLWPKLEPTFTELQSEWGMYACKSKRKQIKKRRHIFVPIFWKWGRKRILYHLLNGHRCRGRSKEW